MKFLLLILSLMIAGNAFGGDGALSTLAGTTTIGATANGAVAQNAGTGTNLTAYGQTTIIPFTPANSALIGEGDSLMSGIPKVFWTLTNQFPNWYTGFGAISNFAVTGSTIATLNTRWTASVAPCIATMKGLGLTNIYLLFDVGANDLGEDSPTFLNLWSNYIVRAQASNCTVITFTILPQTNAGIFANWALANQYMRMSLLPNYLIDWATLMPDPSDVNWYVSDGVHLNTNGFYRVAQAVDNAVRVQARRPVDATYQFGLVSASGKIGLGSLVPNHRLSVGEDTVAAGAAGVCIKQTITTDGFTSQAQGNDDYAYLIHNNSAVVLGADYQQTGAYTPIEFFVSGAEAMRIGANGRVGIGVVPASQLDVAGTVKMGTAGTITTNMRHGISGAMVLGSVTVTDTGCTANTRYFFSAHTLGTISVPGGYYASTRTAGASFVITSSQPTETSTIDWQAIEP